MSTSKVWALSWGMVGAASLVVACSSTEGGPSVAPVESVPAPTASAPAPTASAPTSSPEGGADDAGRAFDESVRVRTEPCEKAAPQATRCESYEIVCGGASPAVVDVAYFEPPAGVAKKGVVVFGSGGGGTGFYNFPARDALTSAGYTLVDRRWTADRGWFDGAKAGPQEAACRYAALARYVKRTHAPSVPLCATGNSGGSAELGYAITRQDSGDLLDLAVPTSGPFHRADLACGGASDATWQSSCRDLVRRHCPTCAPRNCTLGAGPRQLLDLSYGASTPCSGAQTAVDLARMRADSPAAPGVSFRLSHTRVALLVGEMDDGPYAALSAALYESLRAAGVDATFGSEATVHEFQSTDAGARRVEQVILADCVRRH